MEENNNSESKIQLHRIETEFRIFSDKINSLDGQIKSMERDLTQLRDIPKSIKDLGDEVEKVERKTPPIATTVAAFGILATAIGGSLLNTLSLGNTVNEIQSNISTINDDISLIPDEVKDITSRANNNIDEMAASLDRMTGRIDEFESELLQFNQGFKKDFVLLSDELGKQIKRLSELDKRAAELITRLQTPLNIPSVNDSNGQISGLDGLLSGLADQAPPEIRKLIQANSLISEGQYENARKLLLDAKGIDRSDESGIYSAKIAESYMAEENYDLAEQYFLEAIDEDPNEGSYYNNLGSSYFKESIGTDDSERKILLLSKSVSILEKGLSASRQNDGPPSQTLVANLATSLIERSEYSVEDLDIALSVLKSDGEEDDADILYQISRVYALKGEITNSLAFLGRSSEINPLNAYFIQVDDAFDGIRNDASFQEFARNFK